MNPTTLLSLTQACKMAAIGPCLFVVIYLLFSARKFTLVFLPVVYFLSLTCGFLLPILEAMPELNSHVLRAILMFNEHLLPEIGFLFILQLLLQKPPPWPYWLILALPLVGGGPLLYLTLTGDQVCLPQGGCIPAAAAMTLYRVIGSALVFLLLTFLLQRLSPLRRNDTSRRHKYWLVALLILYNLFVMVIDLLRLAGRIPAEQAVFIKTMLGLSFIYLVVSSVFRVFSQSLRLKVRAGGFSPQERSLAHAIEKLLAEHKPYRTIGYRRADMADHFRVTEQNLSRVINRHFGESFSALINRLRVEESQHLLRATESPVTSIAFDCGFASITSFNRVFREATGVSPTEFRKGKL